MIRFDSHWKIYYSRDYKKSKCFICEQEIMKVFDAAHVVVIKYPIQSLHRDVVSDFWIILFLRILSPFLFLHEDVQ